MKGGSLVGRLGGACFLGKLCRSFLEPKFGVASSRKNCLAFSSASTTTTSKHKDLNSNRSASEDTSSSPDRETKTGNTDNILTDSSELKITVKRPPRPKANPGKGSQHHE